MDAALALFAREGFAGTAVTDIEAAAGLSAGSGSFYRHFRSKEDVLFTVVDRELERARERKAGGGVGEGEGVGGTGASVAARLREGQRFLEDLGPVLTIL